MEEGIYIYICMYTAIVYNYYGCYRMYCAAVQVAYVHVPSMHTHVHHVLMSFSCISGWIFMEVGIYIMTKEGALLPPTSKCSAPVQLMKLRSLFMIAYPHVSPFLEQNWDVKSLLYTFTVRKE